MTFTLKIDLPNSTLSLIVTIGQSSVIIFTLLLNIYIDDFRELARKNKKVKNIKIFDWVRDPNILYPGIFGILFISAVIWATVTTDDLKSKIQSAEARHTTEQVTLEKVYAQTDH